MYKDTVGFLAPASRIKDFFVLKNGRKILLFNDDKKGGERLVVREEGYSEIEVGMKNVEIYWMIRNTNKEEIEEIGKAIKKGGIKCLDC